MATAIAAAIIVVACWVVSVIRTVLRHRAGGLR